jgi:hypothetical protein
MPRALGLLARGRQFLQLAGPRKNSMIRLLSLRHTTLAVVAIALLGHSLPASDAQPVPFKGQAVLTVGDAVPIGDNLLLSATATGVATHLGLFTRTETVLVDPFGVFLEGSITFTAANGDELYADVVEGGFTSPDLSTAEGSYIFAGGTGRFEGASGGALFSAVASETGYDVNFDGEIEY